MKIERCYMVSHHMAWGIGTHEIMFHTIPPPSYAKTVKREADKRAVSTRKSRSLAMAFDRRIVNGWYDRIMGMHTSGTAKSYHFCNDDLLFLASSVVWRFSSPKSGNEPRPYCRVILSLIEP